MLTERWGGTPYDMHWREHPMGYLQLLSYLLNLYKAWVSVSRAKDAVSWGEANPDMDRLVKKSQRIRFDLNKQRKEAANG